MGQYGPGRAVKVCCWCQSASRWEIAGERLSSETLCCECWPFSRGCWRAWRCGGCGGAVTGVEKRRGSIKDEEEGEGSQVSQSPEEVAGRESGELRGMGEGDGDGEGRAEAEAAAEAKARQRQQREPQKTANIGWGDGKLQIRRSTSNSRWFVECEE